MSAIEYFIVKGKTVVIPFEKIFHKESLRDYDNFRMIHKSKRFYAESAPIFCKTCNEILNKNKEIAENFLYQYLNLKRAIDHGKLKNPNLFINFLTSNLFMYKRRKSQQSIMELIKDWVNENFINHIDPYYEKNAQKYEQSIMFFERHYKLLFHVTVLSKFAIPICVHFLYSNPEIKMDLDSFIYNVIMELMQLSASVHEGAEKINIYTKLYRHVEKYMNRIAVSDQAGLERLQFHGVTPDSIIETVMKKLITNMLPKYEFDRDIMKFNQSVIRTSIDVYTLRKRDPIPARCLLVDEDGLGDDEKDGIDLFSRYNKAKNEKLVMYRKLLSGPTMDRIAKRLQIDLKADELDFYNKTIEINPLQIILITQLLSKDFEGAENISGCTRFDVIKGIIILHKRMLRLNLVNLANLVVAKKTSAILSKYQLKSLVKKIQTHPLYPKVIETRYGFVKDLFENRIVARSERNHPIIELMRLIINENYVYNGFNDPDNGKPIPKNEDKILDEILEMYTKLMC